MTPNMIQIGDRVEVSFSENVAFYTNGFENYTLTGVITNMPRGAGDMIVVNVDPQYQLNGRHLLHLNPYSNVLVGIMKINPIKE